MHIIYISIYNVGVTFRKVVHQIVLLQIHIFDSTLQNFVTLDLPHPYF